MKLEHVIKRAVFLAPKVYGFVDILNNEIIKVKGLTSDAIKNLHIEDLESLQIKDSSKEFIQSKWYKSVINGKISINEIIYTLRVTSNKRQPVYINYNGKEILNNTKPYNYDDIIKK
jgi:hypothetical protein